MTVFECAAIVLAAGFSRRMGAENKLLLPFGGVSLVRHVVNTYTTAIDGPVLVVLGHQAKSVAAMLAGSGAATVYNPQFQDGQATSVAKGLQQAADARLLLIGLGDQPLLRSRDVVDVLDAHRAADPSKITVPVNGASRGNPIVVPRALRARILEDPKNPGCHNFTRAHPEWVQELDLDADGFFFDVDTPDAYAASLDHLKETLS